jgi:hypothetical protein
MSKTVLAKALSRWAQSSLTLGGEHCLQHRQRFRIPGAGVVDLLTVRHLRPAEFKVNLWSIVPGEVDDRAIDAMSRRLHAFEGWYSELLEHAETQGFSPAHRITVCGNVVGRSVRRSPFVDLLSAWGCSLSFWTWKGTGSAFEVLPYLGKAPTLTSARTQLKALLPHLRWRDTAERDLEAAPRR